MNRRQKDRLLYLFFFKQKLEDYLSEDIQRASSLRACTQMARNGVSGLIDRMLKTASEDEKLYLLSEVRKKEIYVGYKKEMELLSKAQDKYFYLPKESLTVLMGYAIEFACQYCDRNQQEQANCMLREGLIRSEACNLPEFGNTSACPYQGLYADGICSEADRRLRRKWRKSNDKKA